MFVLKRGLIWDWSQVPDTSSNIAIVVGSIREFCAFINLSGTCPNFSISLPIGRSNSHLSSDWSSFCQTKCLRKKNLKQGLKSLNPRPSLILVDFGKWTFMQNLESVAQKMAELWVLMYFLYFFTFVICSEYPYELPCKICSSKNGWVMSTLYFLYVYFVRKSIQLSYKIWSL